MCIRYIEIDTRTWISHHQDDEGVFMSLLEFVEGGNNDLLDYWRFLCIVLSEVIAVGKVG